MKAFVWIPSGVLFLSAVGYGFAHTANLLEAGVAHGDEPAQTGTQTVEFVPPAPAKRIGIGYRRAGDDSFADVAVSTVEPFDTDGDGIADDAQATSHSVSRDMSAGTRAALELASMKAKRASKAAPLRLVSSVSAHDDSGSNEARTGSEADAILPSTWHSSYFTDNPLVGSIVHADGTPSNEGDLMDAAQGARYLLLGEIHDNPDHHRIQADIVGGLTRLGRKPSVVFEMIPQAFSDTLAAFNAASGKDVSAQRIDALGDALKWNERGWPDYSMYEPIVATAAKADLPIVAGDLNGKTIEALGRDGLAALNASDVARLGLDAPLSPQETAAMRDEIRAAHCGLMPDVALQPMAIVQRARNGALADAMVESAQDSGSSVLITGSGHARTDRGVPAVLRRTDPNARSVAVQMVEVDQGEKDVADYGITADAPAPYDFTIFTPRADITDHCAQLRQRMEAAGKGR